MTEEELVKAHMQSIKVSCYTSFIMAAAVVFGLAGLFTHNKIAASIFLVVLATFRTLLDIVVRALSDYKTLGDIKKVEQAFAEGKKQGDPPTEGD